MRMILMMTFLTVGLTGCNSIARDAGRAALSGAVQACLVDPSLDGGDRLSPEVQAAVDAIAACVDDQISNVIDTVICDLKGRGKKILEDCTDHVLGGFDWLGDVTVEGATCVGDGLRYVFGDLADLLDDEGIQTAEEICEEESEAVWRDCMKPAEGSTGKAFLEHLEHCRERKIVEYNHCMERMCGDQ